MIGCRGITSGRSAGPGHPSACTCDSLRVRSTRRNLPYDGEQQQTNFDNMFTTTYAIRYNVQKNYSIMIFHYLQSNCNMNFSMFNKFNSIMIFHYYLIHPVTLTLMLMIVIYLQINSAIQIAAQDGGSSNSCSRCWLFK